MVTELRRYVIKNLKHPIKEDVSRDIDWICNCLGFAGSKDKEKTEIIKFDYLLTNVLNNVASITGSIENKIQINCEFDIPNGHWINYKMFFIKNNEKILLKSFELIK